jgi:hypothetical protein
VSGGLGGRSSLRISLLEDEAVLLGGESADLDLFISVPRSVGSGVGGSVRRDVGVQISSLLCTNSLLYALSNAGYGRLTRSWLGRLVLESSGTRSFVDDESGPSGAASLCFSLIESLR